MTETTTRLEELLERYPGGLAALARDTRLGYSTVRRLKLMGHKRTPWQILRRIARAKGFAEFVGELPQLSSFEHLRSAADQRQHVYNARTHVFVALWREAQRNA